MKAILVGLATLLMLPRPSEACSMKSADISIVLGVVAGEVVAVRFSVSESDTDAYMTSSQWNGTATLHVGTRTTAIGRLDPKAKPDAELARLIADARKQAEQLAGFVSATQVATRDCGEQLRARCGSAVLERKGTSLRIGAFRTPITVDLENFEQDGLAVTGVAHYRAGATKIAVVNVGGGDPKFATGLRACDGRTCRDITTLHHGEQTDVVVVTSP